MAKQNIRKTEHPYIVQAQNLCQGTPIIRGTRIPVWLLINWRNKLGYDAEDLQRLYPQLTLAQIYDAFAYYYDHRTGIDKRIKLEENSEYWKKQFPSKIIAKYRVNR